MEKIKDVKKALRHRDWMERIAECQSSGMSVRDWCKSNGISPNTCLRRFYHARTVAERKYPFLTFIADCIC